MFNDSGCLVISVVDGQEMNSISVPWNKGLTPRLLCQISDRISGQKINTKVVTIVNPCSVTRFALCFGKEI